MRGTAVGQGLAHLRPGSGRHRNDDLADGGLAPVQVTHYGICLAPRPENRHAHDPGRLLQGIVIQEAFHFVTRAAVGMDFANQLRARATRSIYKDADAPLRGVFAEGLVADPDGKPHQRRGHKAEDRIDYQHGSRHGRPYPEHGYRGEQRRSRPRSPETRDTGPGCLRSAASSGKIRPNRRSATSPESRSAAPASGWALRRPGSQTRIGAGMPPSPKDLLPSGGTPAPARHRYSDGSS